MDPSQLSNKPIQTGLRSPMGNFRSKISLYLLSAVILCLMSSVTALAESSRLLRQPDINAEKIVFVSGGDIWTSNLDGSQLLRITSTPAVESEPRFSPDGTKIAFNSNRAGVLAVYVVASTGGTPERLTWYPAASRVKGWTPDGKNVLYTSARESAPPSYGRLWTVPVTGGPSTPVAEQWGFDGSYSPDGKKIAIDRVSRWDVEWRNYRGGQNTPLIILDLETYAETIIPNERTTDIQPLWIGNKIYYLSDRDWTSNIWSFDTSSGKLDQITSYPDSDIKWLAGNEKELVFERDGFIYVLNQNDKSVKQLEITITGDFPWAETKWEDVSSRATSVSLSPTGKRVLIEARGDVFTVPIEFGDPRNLTQTSGAADRAPIWSPKGNQVAWFSDASGEGYSLMVGAQDGMTEPRKMSIGESKMAWEPVWSPDGKSIAFTDDDVRIRVLDIESGDIKTVDIAGNNLERGSMGLTWSPDSKWLAYSKAGSNGFRTIMVWSVEKQAANSLTDPFADSFSPAWDADGLRLYFLASTEWALSSGWANTSSQTSNPEYNAYLINLKKDEPSPFKPKSDEETVKEEEKKSDEKESAAKAENNKKAGTKKGDEKEEKKDEGVKVIIDFDDIQRRIIPLPMPKRNYQMMVTGPKGNVFIMEQKQNSQGYTIHKFTLEKREAKEYISGARQISVSADGTKMLARVNGDWKVMDTDKPSGSDGKSVKVNLQVKLDRAAEWKQIFEEAWRVERDYFYDPNLHGRDWQVVYQRYSPLVPHIRHRDDLTYILDMMNGELSVGHSFVGGGDYPETDRNTVGLLGADLESDQGRWKIKRIYTAESWNPELSSPLDRPELKIREGNYLTGINGNELTANDDPYRFLDGTAAKQTIIHINSSPAYEGSWKEIVTPISSENDLRTRAWVEDNRRLVDSLSNGRLAYVWVPNTGGSGFVSFNRYFFAQQDKEGAVIDERFNGGGLLDDYMVDLMTRSLRASLTNEVPNGKPLRLPAGILGPKVLLVNEMAGSGGDFFPWVFRQQKAGPLIGTTTWGGLVKSSVHYPLIDGGMITAPDNAVFDPINRKWIAENTGVAPDIEVRQDAQSLQKGEDPQLLRAIKEALRLIDEQRKPEVIPPPFPKPAVKP
ncbi:uncharacterized N-terminal domain of tricorn protease [Bacteroidales bacterium 6E]|nr:uncharacterized N-terminal domain of tricorn protease [Bacteroidales bacterium 6E]